MKLGQEPINPKHTFFDWSSWRQSHFSDVQVQWNNLTVIRSTSSLLIAVTSQIFLDRGQAYIPSQHNN